MAVGREKKCYSNLSFILNWLIATLNRREYTYFIFHTTSHKSKVFYFVVVVKGMTVSVACDE